MDPQGAHARLQVEVQSAGDEQSCWAAVARDLREKQKEGATLRIATRGLQMGDVCVADVTVTRNDAAENNVVSRQQGVQLDTDTAETSFVPGDDGHPSWGRCCRVLRPPLVPGPAVCSAVHSVLPAM